jgi:hypothetical protein
MKTRSVAEQPASDTNTGHGLPKSAEVVVFGQFMKNYS